MISIYYIKTKKQQKHGMKEHLGMPKGHTQVELGQTDDEAASAIHRTSYTHSLTYTNSFMLI